MICIPAVAATLLAAQSAPGLASGQRPAVTSTLAASSQASAALAAGTPVIVMLDQALTTTTSKVGDIFEVTVLHEVVDGTTVVIPQGAIGHGEVTFVTKRGGFGKAGIIGLTLHDLQLGERKVALDGHYREEGKNRNGATAATFFAVGIFSGFIRGNETGIPKGRELKARTGEAIAYIPGASPPPVPATAAIPSLPDGDAVPAAATPATVIPVTAATVSRRL